MRGAVLALAVLMHGCSVTQKPAASGHVTAGVIGGLAVAHSPNGSVQVAVTNPWGFLNYTVQRNGETLIAPSAPGLSFAITDPASPARSSTFGDLHITGVEQRSGVDAYRPLLGKTSQVNDAYNEVTIHAQETAAPSRRLDLVIRAYDAGVALRLVLPQQPGITRVDLAGETTQFLFPENFACTGFNPGQADNSHEGEFDDVDAAKIRPHEMYDDPLLCRTSRGTAIAFAESDVENYPGTYFSGLGNGLMGVQTHLAAHGGALAVSVPMTADGVKTPWRVVMMADRPEQLLESNMITDLAAPSRVADTGWIKPGLATWDWWSGPDVPNLQGDGHNDATYKLFIDQAAKMHLPYTLIDEGWSKGSGGGGYVLPAADVTKSAPDVHLEELVAYAKERHVGLWLWLNWSALDKQMDAALTWYEKLGIRGIKVDFMDRQDQAMVEFYHRLLTKAAAHHIMVDLHGAYTPRGLERTYPNFVTQEGVMGAEYNKWSRRETAGHNVRLAYTRALLGPMDYTPGAFGNVRPADFRPKNIGPMVMTTRAQQLAMYVVYTSYFACVSDSPGAYTGANGALLPGTEFFAHVPTTWDETRGIGGEFPHWIGVARRSGKDWYVGVMNDDSARDVTLALPFAAQGKWVVRQYTDGAEPKDLVIGAPSASGSMNLHLAASGGAVLEFHAE
jgi:alpha-glucosidase